MRKSYFIIDSNEFSYVNKRKIYEINIYYQIKKIYLKKKIVKKKLHVKR